MATGSVRLSWDDVNEIEKGHRIYRSESPMNVGDLPTPIATVGSDITEYVDENLTVGDIWYYRVSAFIDTDEQVSSEVQVQVKAGYNIYTVSEDGNTIKINSNGEEEFVSTLHTAPINDISIDQDDNFFTASDDNLLMMVNSNGIKQWEYDHEIEVLTVCVDNLGFVYTGDETGILRKFDYTGELVWSVFAHEAAIEKIHCDYGNVLYTTSNDSILKRWNGDGMLDDMSMMAGIITDISTDIYTSNIYVSIGNDIIILDYTLNVINTINAHTNSIVDISFDKEGYIVSGSLDSTVKRHDNSGTLISSYMNDAPITSLSCDDFGNIFFSDNTFELKMLNSNNEIVWEYLQHTSTINRVNLTKNLEIVPNLDYSISWEELKAPSQRSGINETQISTVLIAPTPLDITESNIKELSKPTNVDAVYDINL